MYDVGSCDIPKIVNEKRLIMNKIYKFFFLKSYRPTSTNVSMNHLAPVAGAIFLSLLKGSVIPQNNHC